MEDGDGCGCCCGAIVLLMVAVGIFTSISFIVRHVHIT